MAGSKKDYRGLSPAEQRAARDQRLASQVDQVEVAKQREMKMVANLGQFTDECRWFMANKVWLTLGYETLVAWWAARIAPVVEQLGLKPGPELAQLAIEAIQEEEASLPSAQRHTKKAIGAIVGVGEWKARGRQDPRQRRSAAGGDLEGGPEVYDGEVVEPVNPIAAFDEKYSGNVSTPPSDVPGQAAADTDTASADGSPVPEPAGKAGGEPAGQGLTAEVLPGKPQDSPADSESDDQRDEVALVASQPGSFQDLTDGQTPPPSMGSVLSPAAVPGVAAAGDEVGEESEAGPLDSSSTDPAAVFMELADRLTFAIAQLDYDVVAPMLTEKEFRRLDTLAVDLGGAVDVLHRWAEQ